MSRLPLRYYLAALLLLAISIYLLQEESYKPLHLIETNIVPFFIDDMDRDSLINCAEKQLHFLTVQKQSRKVDFGQLELPYSWLTLSLSELLKFLKSNPDIVELNRFLKDNYLVFQAGGREKRGKRQMLVTGYYEPLFAGSLVPTPSHRYPIYKLPPSLIQETNSHGTKRIGRLSKEGTLVNYWSRSEIETENILAGHELAYLTDPFDAYLLHIQGSGKILLPDGTTRSVRFAGSNGLQYNSIGKLLVDEKIMMLEDVNIPVIRKYLEHHPNELQRVLHHNPRFIFFSLGDNLGPRGSSGEVLTPGRSIAIDAMSLPGGTFAYLQSRKPVINKQGIITGWAPLGHFVFPQDAGSAIKGSGRVDLFWGNGLYAETAANTMKEAGTLYFLVKKGYPGN